MNIRNLAIWGAIALLVIGMAVAFSGNSSAPRAEPVSISKIYDMASEGKLLEATIGNEEVIVTTTDGDKFKSELRVFDDDTQAKLLAAKVKVNVDADSGSNSFTSLLFSILPIVLIVGFVFFMMRQMQGLSLIHI